MAITTVFERLESLDEKDGAEHLAAAAAEIAGVVSELDDLVRGWITNAEDVKDNFEDKSIKDLREHCEDMLKALNEIQTALY